ncbi:hypothetical protein JCM4814A_01940 [Streptomyces phaeofaciens JCM 4814]|uniref:Uncharacterized protein n=1 Tax=Streptomyces phaeofaciens TaxID=68254 RepID=A0A918M217_9ACTN|nr:hypothetical protein [Streptomyces phaeofaciens]GGU00519.1 hypothetical protein GCM10010226_91710 [Streptomyces phaeofaciens]
MHSPIEETAKTEMSAAHPGAEKRDAPIFEIEVSEVEPAQIMPMQGCIR